MRGERDDRAGDGDDGGCRGSWWSRELACGERELLVTVSYGERENDVLLPVSRKRNDGCLLYFHVIVYKFDHSPLLFISLFSICIVCKNPPTFSIFFPPCSPVLFPQFYNELPSLSPNSPLSFSDDLPLFALFSRAYL